jgi:hypothetical protein
MRYLVAEKLEIIRLVGQSPLPARRTLAKLGIPRARHWRASSYVLQWAERVCRNEHTLSSIRRSRWLFGGLPN